MCYAVEASDLGVYFLDGNLFLTKLCKIKFRVCIYNGLSQILCLVKSGHLTSYATVLLVPSQVTKVAA